MPANCEEYISNAQCFWCFCSLCRHRGALWDARYDQCGFLVEALPRSPICCAPSAAEELTLFMVSKIPANTRRRRMSEALQLPDTASMPRGGGQAPRLKGTQAPWEH